MRSVRSIGFTIVELLIVIVVIGILAAIVVVAYNGITKSAQATSIASEMRQWNKLFELYKAKYGELPRPSATPSTGGGPGPLADDAYCLGTGFPIHNGTAYCYAYNNAQYLVEESRGATLLAELSKVGKPPQNSTKYIYGSVVGPLLRWYSDSDIRLYGIFIEGTVCADMGLGNGYTGWGRQECFIRLNQ
jgi:prepilin-type N-terminal cleavage/methylation domain-containing protein